MRMPILLGVSLVALSCHLEHALAQSDREASGAALNPMHGLSKSALSGFRDRPLFNPAREEPKVSVPAPEAPVVPPPPPPPEPPPALKLLGIINGAGDFAVVRTEDAQKTKILANGDHFGAWIVTVLPPTGLRLTDGQRTAQYEIFSHDRGQNQPASAAGQQPGAVGSPP